MISAFPIPGAQLALASRFFSPEMGFAIGWLYWYCYIGASVGARRPVQAIRPRSHQFSSPLSSRLRPLLSRTGRLRARIRRVARGFAAMRFGLRSCSSLW